MYIFNYLWVLNRCILSNPNLDNLGSIWDLINYLFIDVLCNFGDWLNYIKILLVKNGKNEL